MQGAAPSDEIINKIWDQVKVVDAGYSDLTCDPSLSQPAPTAKFLGNGALYKKIIEAN